MKLWMWFLLALAFGGALSVGYARGYDAAETVLSPKLEAALRDGEAWRVAAARHQANVLAQTDLAAACLKREADAQTDAAERAAILGLPPVSRENAPPEKRYENTTRRAALAGYLNRPL